MEWIEPIADNCIWLLPLAAVVATVAIRLVQQDDFRSLAERAFFAVLLFVGAGTFRTIAANDPSWLLHTMTLGAMVIAAVLPRSNTKLDSLEF